MSVSARNGGRSTYLVHCNRSGGPRAGGSVNHRTGAGASGMGAWHGNFEPEKGEEEPARQAGRQPIMQGGPRRLGDATVPVHSSNDSTAAAASVAAAAWWRTGLVVVRKDGGALVRAAELPIWARGGGWGGAWDGRHGPLTSVGGPPPHEHLLVLLPGSVRFGRFGTQTPQIQAGRPAGVFLLPPRPGGGGWMGGWVGPRGGQL